MHQHVIINKSGANAPALVEEWDFALGPVYVGSSLFLLLLYYREASIC